MQTSFLLAVLTMPFCYLSGRTEEASETAPNAAAKCAQQAVKLLSEFLNGYPRLAQAKPETADGVLPFYQVPTGPGPSRSPVTNGSGLPSGQTEQGPEAIDVPADKGRSDLQSSYLQRVPAASSNFFPEESKDAWPSAGSTVAASCTAMWSQACGHLFPQVIFNQDGTLEDCRPITLALWPLQLGCRVCHAKPDLLRHYK